MRLFNSAVNLHARLMKSRSVLARLLGCSHIPYLTGYIYPTGLRLCCSQTMKSGFLICPCIRTICMYRIITWMNSLGPISLDWDCFATAGDRHREWVAKQS